MRARTARSLLYLFAGIGLIVAIFAGLEFYEASLRSLCSINSYFSCSTVDTSGKTSTLGIPDYLWGIGGFVLILLFAGISESRPRDRRWVYAVFGLTTVGVALSLYFFYVQIAVIGALCVVCATSYVFGWLSWVAAILLVRAPAPRPREAKGGAPPEPSDSDDE